MKVLFNLYDVSPGKGRGSGAFYFAQSLLRELLNMEINIKFILVVNNDFYLWANFLSIQKENVDIISLSKNIKLLRPIIENIVIPIIALTKKVDIIHTLFSTGLLWNAPFVKIISVMDLAYFYYQEKFPCIKSIKMKYYLKLLPIMWKKADGIVTISEFTKRELIKRIGIEENKIKTIYLGYRFQNMRDAYNDIHNEIRIIPEKGKYFLLVASDAPNKNVLGLIDSVEILVHKFKMISHTFVIVGRIRNKKFEYHVTKDFLMNKICQLKLGNYFILTGQISDGELNYLYKHMDALIFPSFYEGFGLPILEAYYHNKPVICSWAASIPELGRHMAIYFDPYDPVDIARKIAYFIENRENLEGRNYKEYSTRFSFKKTAKEYIDYYKELLSARETTRRRYRWS